MFGILHCEIITVSVLICVQMFKMCGLFITDDRVCRVLSKH